MRSTSFLALCIVLLVPFAFDATPAQAAEATPEFPVKVVERVLSNGLKVLVIPRKGAPAASCAIAYRVGSLNERPGQTGMAHYLEHMMFKGTEKMGVKDLALDAKLREALDAVIAEKIRLEDGPRAEEVESRLEALKAERSRLIDEQKQNLELNHLFTIYREGGATFTNAMTSPDWTSYICALPPEKVELFFWVEADRLQHCIFRQFHAEKDVVREERRMRENRPGALFNEGVQRALFGSHPYAHSVLGSHEDLRALTRPELRAFFDAYYAPDNAVLFVGGDVDPERIFALAERYFGSISPSTGKRPRVPVLAVPRSGEIRMEGRGEGRSSVDLHFRVPAAGTDDALALKLLAMQLGDEEGDLFEDLVEEDKVAISLDAAYDGRKAGGVLLMSATLSPTGTHKAAEARMWKAVQALRDAPLSDEAMSDLRRRYRAGVLGAVRSDMMLGFTILGREMSGSWHDIERDLVRVKTLPASAVQQLAQTYLVPENVLVSEYTKDEAMKEDAADAVDVGPAPAPVPSRLAAAKPAQLTASPAPSAALPGSWKDLEFEEAPFVLPSGTEARHVLSNGIRAFVVPNVGDPVLRISAEVLGGSAEDPTGKEGLSTIAAGVLGEAGIAGLDAAALKKHLEGLVATVSTGSGIVSHTVSISVFPTDLDEGLRILDLLLREPALDVAAFERIKESMLSRIDGEDTRMRGVTGRLYRRLLWGDVPETRRPTKESVKAITLDDVRAKLASSTGPKRILLAVSGDFDVAKMRAKLDEALGGWNPEGIPSYERPTVRNDKALAARGLHVRDMPTSQGSVRIGQVTVKATDEDAPALRALAAVLARRAFNSIRSVHGLAYQASARFAPSWRNDSPFTLLFQSKCESVPFAIDLGLTEIEKLIQDGPTDAEVDDAKSTLDARFRSILGQGSRAAAAFATLEAEGADLDHYDRLRKAYAGLDAAALKAAAVEHLDPAKLVVLCVGDVAKMAPGDGQHPATLADLGEMTPHEATHPIDAGGPEAVVGQILAALEAGDVDALKGHASKALRARLDAMDDASERLGRLQSLLQSAEVAAPVVTTSGDQAEARVGITATMGEQTLKLGMHLGLVHVEGSWKCDTFQVGP